MYTYQPRMGTKKSNSEKLKWLINFQWKSSMSLVNVIFVSGCFFFYELTRTGDDTAPTTTTSFNARSNTRPIAMSKLTNATDTHTQPGAPAAKRHAHHIHIDVLRFAFIYFICYTWITIAAMCDKISYFDLKQTHTTKWLNSRNNNNLGCCI